MTLHSSVDHLVVAAASLDEGVAWCREVLGIGPDSGGEHAWMGTHNRVFRIASDKFPRAYFEIIAINAAAPAPARTRWFDLDDTSLRQRIARGPRLIHFVANTNDAQGAVAALAHLGVDRGPLLPAQRATPAGMLRWKITVRGDGARLFDGTLPTLIEWESRHPAESLPDCGVALQALEVAHPEAAQLRQAFDSIGLEHITVSKGAPNLAATLSTPKGVITLDSAGT